MSALSRFFADHASAYDAEINDLMFDSEGHDVLSRRLADKRGQVGFLVKLMDESPEMLAAAFHRGFGFPSPAYMDRVVMLEPEAFPAWTQVAASVTIAPWAQALAATVLREPTGARFMTIAAALEYLHQRTDHRSDAGDGADDEDGSREGEEAEDDGEALQEAKEREEAGASWLVEQGFDPQPGRD